MSGTAGGWEQDFGRALETHRLHARRLLERPEVTGVGVGLRRRLGLLTGECVLKVYVHEKRSKNELAEPLPSALNGTNLDVEAMNELGTPGTFNQRRRAPRRMAQARLRVPRRPAMGGSSIAHYEFPVGTVSLGVIDLRTGAHCLLSCSHVLAQLLHARVGDAVLQPAPSDGGVRPRSVIGWVLRWSELRFNGDANHADAAIAVCAPGAALSYVDGIGPIQAIAPDVRLGETMRKVGRATGLTEGPVTAVKGLFRANYLRLGFGETPALFEDQICVDLETGQGDSGSLLVHGQNRAAGILFAASDRDHAWFNPFPAVADALAIGLIPWGATNGRK